MKREYTSPEMEVTWMERENVITTSEPGGFDPDKDNTGFVPEP